MGFIKNLSINGTKCNRLYMSHQMEIIKILNLQSISPVGIFPSVDSFSDTQSKILSNVFVKLNRSLKL